MSYGAAPVMEYLDFGPCLDTWDASTRPVPYMHPPTSISTADEIFRKDPPRIFGDPLLFLGMLDDTPSLWIQKIVRQFLWYLTSVSKLETQIMGGKIEHASMHVSPGEKEGETVILVRFLSFRGEKRYAAGIYGHKEDCFPGFRGKKGVSRNHGAP